MAIGAGCRSPVPWTASGGAADHEFPVAGDTANILGNEISLSQDESVAELNFSGDILHLDGHVLRVTSAGSWTSGVILGGGTFSAEDGIFGISPSGVIRLEATIANQGRLVFNCSTNLLFDAGAELTNAPGGVIELQGNSSLVNGAGSGSPPVVVNAGQFLKTGGGTAFLDSAVVLDNRDTMDVQSGLLQVRGSVVQLVNGNLSAGTWIVRTNATLEWSGGSITTNHATVILDGSGASFSALGLSRNAGAWQVRNGASWTTTGFLDNSGSLRVGTGSSVSARGDITQTASGELSGDGAVNAVLDNSGLVRPGDPLGTLFVNGNLRLGASSRIELELGGTNQPNAYDQLQTTGDVQFDGTLDVVLVTSFAPQAGDRFRIMPYSSHSGTFSVMHLPELAGDLVLIPLYESDGLVLLTVPRAINLLRPQMVDGVFSIFFTTVPGIEFVVEVTESLNPPYWEILDTFSGDGNEQTVNDFGDFPQRYYRLRLQ